MKMKLKKNKIQDLPGAILKYNKSLARRKRIKKKREKIRKKIKKKIKIRKILKRKKVKKYQIETDI